MKATKHWKCWLMEPPRRCEPIAIRRSNESDESIVIPELLDPLFNVANLWWRLWPQDGDL